VKRDHQLVLRGPYVLVRHPIYSGLLLGMLGTAITAGEVRGLVGFAILFYAWLAKSRVEEAFMTEQFGMQYTQYRQRVKAIIPFVL
jgi:protein-S-isoprenylcysteine O-methyltransferase Ste14